MLEISQNGTDAEIARYLSVTEKSYRTNGQGKKEYIEFLSFDDFLSDAFITRLFDVLISWGMNDRGAKLIDVTTFSNSLRNNTTDIFALQHHNYIITDVNISEVQPILKKLYDNLDLVEHAKPKFVTYAKTFHLLFPNLFPPMDRKFTLTFFNENLPKDDERSFLLMMRLFDYYIKFSKTHNLSQFVDKNGWNQNIPKILDNLIIGYFHYGNVWWKSEIGENN